MKVRDNQFVFNKMHDLIADKTDWKQYPVKEHSCNASWKLF